MGVPYMGVGWLAIKLFLGDALLSTIGFNTIADKIPLPFPFHLKQISENFSTYSLRSTTIILNETYCHNKL